MHILKYEYIFLLKYPNSTHIIPMIILTLQKNRITETIIIRSNYIIYNLSYTKGSKM